MAAASRGAPWVARMFAVTLLACILAGRGAASARSLGRGQKPYRVETGRLIVKLRPDVVAAMDDSANGLRFTRQAGLPNAGLYSILDGTEVHEKAKQVSQLAAVEFAEPDYLVRVDWEPNDSLIKAQWHHVTINSQEAWNASTGSSKVKVCHIDSGVRADHPDLVGRIFKGWNLVPEMQDLDAESPPINSAAYQDINDTYGHGTHTAGIIAAVGNNALGVAGVAMDVRLLVCRFIWDDGFGSISDALECLRLCREEGATVSTNSWGGVPHSKAIDAALLEMKAAGMLFVVASGNQATDLDARPAFPASSGGMDNVIVVGSSSRSDELSSFSNYGRSTVHLLAPGEQILSTTYNSWYGPMDGTSMSCPLVAASAALLQSAALSQGVTLTYGQVKRLLLSTVDIIGGKAAAATSTGGRLNIGAAMQALSLLLQEQGQPALPGMALVAADAEELQRTMLQNEWGQELLQAPASGSVSAISSSDTTNGSLTDAQRDAPQVQSAAGAVQQEALAPAPPSTKGRRRLRVPIPSG